MHETDEYNIMMNTPTADFKQNAKTKTQKKNDLRQKARALQQRIANEQKQQLDSQQTNSVGEPKQQTDKTQETSVNETKKDTGVKPKKEYPHLKNWREFLSDWRSRNSEFASTISQSERAKHAGYAYRSKNNKRRKTDPDQIKYF